MEIRKCLFVTRESYSAPCCGRAAAKVAHSGKEAELRLAVYQRKDRAFLHLPTCVAELILAFIFVCIFLMKLHEASGRPEVVIQQII